jgi:hypothetical protein
MANSSDSSLNQAFTVLSEVLGRLEAAADVAAQERAQSAAAREGAQAEITASWQEHTAQIEADLAALQSENSFLKEDNLRLSNQLQQLQRDYLELQASAGNALNRLDVTVKQLDLLLEH